MLALEARMTVWHPDADSLPGIAIEAFAEPGHAPQVPAPLMRVPRGTEVRVTVRNTLPQDTLTFFLHGDSVTVPPGEARAVRARMEVPGTFLYYAVTSAPVARLLQVGGLLSGALVVDSTTTRPRDRVFVLQTAADSAEAGGGEPRRAVHAVNGRSWPYTERLIATIGDTLHWRVVNAANTTHPMHLHGFYYRVDALDGPRVARDGQGATGRMVVTERLSPFATMAMTWVPERGGNWLFHCHFQEHVAPHGTLNGLGPGGEQRRIGAPPNGGPAERATGHGHHDALTGMAGPVLGILVRPRAGTAASPPNPARRVRRLRLLSLQDPAFPDSQPSMRFVLDDPATGARTDAGRGISPTLVLTRGEPVAITVVNQMREAVAVHWHGIELESYFDGVPGFSGGGTQVAPSIAPGDSFVAHFAPPRAGTFMYHSHVEEPRHHRGGLVGALIVRDAAAELMAAEDVIFVLKTAREGGLNSEGIPRTPPVPIEINGRVNPDTTRLRVGRQYRLRLVGLPTGRPNLMVWLTASPDSALTIAGDSLVMRWRPVAKDGADLPNVTRTPRPARQIVSMGETYDFEFIPHGAGLLRLEVRSGDGRARLLGRAPIRVD